MAVRKSPTSTDEVENFNISNGDLETLRRVREQYRLADTEDVIAFAIGVLSEGKGRPIVVESDTGSTLRLMPADSIRADG